MLELLGGIAFILMFWAIVGAMSGDGGTPIQGAKSYVKGIGLVLAMVLGIIFVMSILITVITSLA